MIVEFIESILKSIREWGMIVNGSEVGINGGERESQNFRHSVGAILVYIKNIFSQTRRCSFPTQLTSILL